MFGSWFLPHIHCSGLRLGSRKAFMSTLIICPPGSGAADGLLPSLLGGTSLYWLGIGGNCPSSPLPKSVGSCSFCEYLRFTRSAVLSGRWGLSRDASGLWPDLFESTEGRAEPEMVAEEMPVGMGALIWRVLMSEPLCFPGLGRFSLRFLRSEMPLLRSSDMAPTL